MRELPRLRVCRGSLSPWGLQKKRREVQIRNQERARKESASERTLLILWKPYIFSCLTKLLNYYMTPNIIPCKPVVRMPEKDTGKERTLLCLKWDPRIVLLNSPTLETTKLQERWNDLDNLELGKGVEIIKLLRDCLLTLFRILSKR